MFRKKIQNHRNQKMKIIVKYESLGILFKNKTLNYSKIKFSIIFKNYFLACAKKKTMAKLKLTVLIGFVSSTRYFS